MKVNYKRPFNQFVKKANRPLQLAIEDVVDFIRYHPEMGEMKVGDLAGMRVYKFRFNRQEHLVAYRSPATVNQLGNTDQIEFLTIEFYQVGTHQNFYEMLKRFLREE
jgi:hypothetical protein